MGHFRRIFPVAAPSSEGLLTEPTAAAQPRRRERVLMPHSGHCPELVAALRAEEKTAIHSERGCYSMTSSARARIVGGIVRPSSFAVLRLTTSSILVGCWTGRSAGLAP